ncbi:MAG: pyroglutamyl-peptidase [Kiritimatiellia bacterium]|jgi:pyroglutamyl-peptidase
MGERPILITGFSAFLDVSDNPSGALANAVDGRVVQGVPIVGRILPVSYARAPELTSRWVTELDARAVVGMGVACGRSSVMVERSGGRRCADAADVDGVVLDDLGEGPDRREATLDAQALATALGATVSDDAGGYVCNAWLYRVVGRVVVPAVFIHVPPSGLEPLRLLHALGVLVEDGVI